MSAPRVMLGSAEVEELLDLWDEGWSLDELAEEFGCSRATVSLSLEDLLDDEEGETDDFDEDEEDPEDW